MSRFDKILESKVKVRFPDCDPFNHLNNSRYIDYMINAREDQLLEYYQFDVYKRAFTEGISWVSAQTQISYLQPALLNETVIVQTRLLLVTERSLLLEALMWDNEKTMLKSVMWARLVHYHIRELKSWSHSPDLLEFFGQIVAPLDESTTFDNRVAQLKSSLKSMA
jgi:YbgC/YbaW family acyl-CoA thioester hydrolase